MRRVNSRLLSVSAYSLLRGTRSRPASLRATNYLKLYGIIFDIEVLDRAGLKRDLNSSEINDHRQSDVQRS